MLRKNLRNVLLTMWPRPEGQSIYKRIWRGDGTDTADKLSDPNPLTPAERNALVQVHNRAVQCRQFLDAYDSQYAGAG
jgi:hypothetical protein